MASVWRVTTNDGIHFVTCEPNRKQMYAYIRLKKKQGYALREIHFCWGLVDVKHIIQVAMMQKDNIDLKEETDRHEATK